MRKMIDKLIILNQLDKIYVINDEGLNLFSLNDNLIKNKLIFAGYIKALHDLAIEISGEALSCFEFGNVHFEIYNCESQNLLFIGGCDINYNNEETLRELRQVSELFCKTYSAILQNFNGDTSYFRDFGINLISLSELKKIAKILGVNYSEDNNLLLRIINQIKYVQLFLKKDLEVIFKMDRLERLFREIRREVDILGEGAHLNDAHLYVGRYDQYYAHLTFEGEYSKIVHIELDFSESKYKK